MSSLIEIPRPAWLTEQAWPWPVRGLSTSVGRIAVTDTGGDGPLLLFAHVGMWSFLWRDLIRDLSADHRCVTFDAPGTGLSQRRVSYLADASVAIGELVDALDLRDLTLVVHDLGGGAAFAAFADRPERVQRLVAVNTFAWRPRGAGFRTALAVVGNGLVREVDALGKLLPAASSGRFGAGRHWKRADRKVFRAAFDRRAVRAVHRYLGDARHADALLERADAALRGPLADRPLITIFGQFNDPLHLQPQWRERFPAARQEIVRGGYHFPMCDAPGQVAGWIRAHLAAR